MLFHDRQGTFKGIFRGPFGAHRIIRQPVVSETNISSSFHIGAGQKLFFFVFLQKCGWIGRSTIISVSAGEEL